MAQNPRELDWITSGAAAPADVRPVTPSHVPDPNELNWISAIPEDFSNVQSGHGMHQTPPAHGPDVGVTDIAKQFPEQLQRTIMDASTHPIQAVNTPLISPETGSKLLQPALSHFMSPGMRQAHPGIQQGAGEIASSMSTPFSLATSAAVPGLAEVAPAAAGAGPIVSGLTKAAPIVGRAAEIGMGAGMTVEAYQLQEQIQEAQKKVDFAKASGNSHEAQLAQMEVERLRTHQIAAAAGAVAPALHLGQGLNDAMAGAAGRSAAESARPGIEAEVMDTVQQAEKVFQGKEAAAAAGPKTVGPEFEQAQKDFAARRRMRNYSSPSKTAGVDAEFNPDTQRTSYTGPGAAEEPFKSANERAAAAAAPPVNEPAAEAPPAAEPAAAEPKPEELNWILGEKKEPAAAPTEEPSPEAVATQPPAAEPAPAAASEEPKFYEKRAAPVERAPEHPISKLIASGSAERKPTDVNAARRGGGSSYFIGDDGGVAEVDNHAPALQGAGLTPKPTEFTLDENVDQIKEALKTHGLVRMWSGNGEVSLQVERPVSKEQFSTLAEIDKKNPTAKWVYDININGKKISRGNRDFGDFMMDLEAAEKGKNRGLYESRQASNKMMAEGPAGFVYKDTDSGPVIYASPKSYQDLIDSGIFPQGSEAVTPLNLDADWLAHIRKTAIDKMNPATLRMAKLFQRAKDEGHNSIPVIPRAPGQITLKQTIKARRHEEFHRRLVEAKIRPITAEPPHANTAVPAMARRGYAQALMQDMPSTFMHESLAFITSGDHEGIGLTPEQALDIVKHYKKHFTAQVGEQKMKDLFRRTAPGPIREEIYGKQERPGNQPGRPERIDERGQRRGDVGNNQPGGGRKGTLFESRGSGASKGFLTFRKETLAAAPDTDPRLIRPMWEMSKGKSFSDAARGLKPQLRASLANKQPTTSEWSTDSETRSDRNGPFDGSTGTVAKHPYGWAASVKTGPKKLSEAVGPLFPTIEEAKAAVDQRLATLKPPLSMRREQRFQEMLQVEREALGLRKQRPGEAGVFAPFAKKKPKNPLPSSPKATKIFEAQHPEKPGLMERILDTIKSMPDKGQKLYRQLESDLDMWAPMRRLEKEMKKRGIIIAPEESAYNAATLEWGGGMGSTEATFIRTLRIVLKADKAGVLEELRMYLNLKGNIRAIEVGEEKLRDAIAAKDQADIRYWTDALAQDKIAAAGYSKQELLDDLLTLQNGMTPDKRKIVLALGKEEFQLNRTTLDQYSKNMIEAALYHKLIARGDEYVNMSRIMDVLDRESYRQGSSLGLREQHGIKVLSGSERINRDPFVADPENRGIMYRDMARNHAAMTLVDLKDVDPTGFGTLVRRQHPGMSRQPGEGIVPIIRKGIRENWFVPEEFASALENASASHIRLLGATMLSKTGKIFRDLYTSMNPAFVATNIIKDTGDTRLLTGKPYNPKDFIQYLGKMGEAAASIIKKDDAYLDFLESGAAYSGLSYQIDPFVRMKRLWGTEDGWIREHSINKIAETNAVGEATSKMAARAHLIEKGVHPIIAAVEARINAGTPDVGNAGQRLREANRLLMFFAATAKGVERNIRFGSNYPKKLAILAATMLIREILLQHYNSKYPDPEDPTKQEWNKVSRADKQKYYVMLLPVEYQSTNGERRLWGIKLIRPHLASMLGNALGQAYEGIFGKHSAEDSIANALGVDKHHPFKSIAEGGASMLHPIVQIPIEQVINTETYSDTPIVPKSMEERPPYLQYDEKTSPAAVKLSKAVQGVSDAMPKFINKYTKDLPAESPKRIEQLIRSLGPPAEMAESVAELPFKGPEIKPEGPERIARMPLLGPILRRFVIAGGNQERKDKEEDFYDLLSRSKIATQGVYRGFESAKERENVIDRYVKNPEDLALAMMAPAIQKQSDNMTQVRSFVSNLSRSTEFDDAEKRSRAHDALKIMDQILTTNELFKAVVDEVTKADFGKRLLLIGDILKRNPDLNPEAAPAETAPAAPEEGK